MAQFFTDFSGASVGSAPPTGWTRRWAATAAPDGFRVEDLDAGAPVVPAAAYANEGGSQSFDALSWDAVGSVSGDVEIVGLFNPGSTSGTRGGFVLCASTSATSGYLFAIGAGTETVISIMTAGTEDFATNSFTFSGTTDYWIRAQYIQSSNTIRMRVWADGGSEPGTWNQTRTDATAYSSGVVGLFGRSINGLRYWKRVGVGTAGDAAPTAPVSGASIPRLSFGLRQTLNN